MIFVSLIQLSTVLNTTHISIMDYPNCFVTAHRSIFIYSSRLLSISNYKYLINWTSGPVILRTLRPTHMYVSCIISIKRENKWTIFLPHMDILIYWCNHKIQERRVIPSFWNATWVKKKKKRVKQYGYLDDCRANIECSGVCGVRTNQTYLWHFGRLQV